LIIIDQVVVVVVLISSYLIIIDQLLKHDTTPIYCSGKGGTDEGSWEEI
jgi:hypothetical protein